MRKVFSRAVVAALAVPVMFFSAAPANAVSVTYDFVVFEVSFEICRETSPGVSVCQFVTVD